MPPPPIRRHPRLAALLLAALAAPIALAGCSLDDWFGDGEDRPCTDDIDCPILASCVDGTCELFGPSPQPDATPDAGGAPDAGAAPDAGGSPDAAPADSSTPIDTTPDIAPSDTSSPDTSSPTVDLWLDFGTRGSTTGLVNTEAQCDKRSVRTDDLDRATPQPPSGSWAGEPILDERGFCGSDDETLGWRLLNCERISRDIPPLKCDLRLVWTAREHSADMRDRGYFDHTNPDGLGPSGRIEAHGVDGWNAVGENIAGHPSTESAHLGWMESPGHKANILSTAYVWAGQGVAYGGPYGQYDTQVFMKRFADR